MKTFTQVKNLTNPNSYKTFAQYSGLSQHVRKLHSRLIDHDKHDKQGKLAKFKSKIDFSSFYSKQAIAMNQNNSNLSAAERICKIK